MASAPREAYVPLTRWQYFMKNLYRNGAASAEFTYNKVVYLKSEALQAADAKSASVNYVLLIALIAMFLLTSRYQNVWIVIAYLVLAVAGETYRLLLLPKDIRAHLTDTHRRER